MKLKPCLHRMCFSDASFQERAGPARLDPTHLDPRFLWPVTEADKRRILREMLSVLHDLLDAAGIPYFITGGTLLGAIRHRDVIHWDQDNDVGILLEDHDRVMTFEPPPSYQLVEPAYVQRTAACRKFFQFNPDAKPEGTLLDDAYRKHYARLVHRRSGLYTDLFHYAELEPGMLSNVSQEQNHTNAREVFFPLKPYVIAGKVLWGPNDPLALFRVQNAGYGDLARCDHHWCCGRRRWVKKFRWAPLDRASRLLFAKWLFFEFDEVQERRAGSAIRANLHGV